MEKPLEIRLEINRNQCDRAPAHSQDCGSYSSDTADCLAAFQACCELVAQLNKDNPELLPHQVVVTPSWKI